MHETNTKGATNLEAHNPVISSIPDTDIPSSKQVCIICSQMGRPLYKLSTVYQLIMVYSQEEICKETGTESCGASDVHVDKPDTKLVRTHRS